MALASNMALISAVSVSDPCGVGCRLVFGDVRTMLAACSLTERFGSLIHLVGLRRRPFPGFGAASSASCTTSSRFACQAFRPKTAATAAAKTTMSTMIKYSVISPVVSFDNAAFVLSFVFTVEFTAKMV